MIPRGVRFRVELLDGGARGYVCENYGAPFRLPDLGPIGANGLANPRDFLTPVAAYEDVDGDFELVAKFMGNLWSGPHGPLAARRGRLARQLRAVQVRPAALQRDRLDQLRPSRSVDLPGAALAAATRRASAPSTSWSSRRACWPCEDTFRPPWFHRNVASEFMGLIHGAYDAKAEGFVPGGASLHNSMSGHGPDAETFEKASAADTRKPDVIENTMAFMFETRQVLRPTALALEIGRAPARVLALLAGLAQALRPGPAMTSPYPIDETHAADLQTVILRGHCERAGARRIGFGECRGTVLPARQAA